MKRNKSQESVSDFRDRIRCVMRGVPENTVLGAAPSDPCVLRTDAPISKRHLRTASRKREKPSPLVRDHVRAGETLGASIGVAIRFEGGVKTFTYGGRAVAYQANASTFYVNGGRLPLRAARALGHFLVANAKENR